MTSMRTLDARSSTPAGRSSGLAVWGGLALAAVVFVVAGRIWDAWLPMAGPPLEPPWFRSAGALFEAADGIGAAGRAQHRLGVLTLDTIIPLTYGWAMHRAARFYLAALGARPKLQALRWIPVAAMLCDFAENAFIVALVSVHPERPGAAAMALLAFSWTKWGLLAITVLGLLAGLIALRFRGRRSSKA
ncbi:MAG TPA: hypothetical protein VFR81_11520 [Longimicrobium sp.]|nr:hypothetical protein [Longimicrobium sp.]